MTASIDLNSVNDVDNGSRLDFELVSGVNLLDGLDVSLFLRGRHVGR